MVGLLLLAAVTAVALVVPAVAGRVRAAPHEVIELDVGDTFYLSSDPRLGLHCQVVLGRPVTVGCAIGDKNGARPGTYSVLLTDQAVGMLRFGPTRIPTPLMRFLQPRLESRPFAPRPKHARQVVGLNADTGVIIGGSHIGCVPGAHLIISCSLHDSVTGNVPAHSYEAFISHHLASVVKVDAPGTPGRIVALYNQP